MNHNRIPEFAIVGHPNEGKSSVVSTLAEDDSVRVSPTPGETITCQTFPVMIDGKEIIRFTDTPGFQNPKQTLEWIKHYQGPDNVIIDVFLQTHRDNQDFRDDCELFTPIAHGAGIIYVADGSRPLRKVDKAEMDILRLTGRPRMAIINCKENETRYLDQWKREFRKHFNAIRVFNAHKATYAERIDLLESLKGIDQEWQPSLETVISAFKKDWEYRNTLTVEIICAMLTDCLKHSITKHFTEKSSEKTVKKKLQEEYARTIKKIENAAHQRIRKLFKHNIFNYDLPDHSILHEDLFNEKTWRFLGLTPTQLIAAAGLAGSVIGAAIDVAAAGLTFGIFTVIGGAAGAGWAAWGGGKRLIKANVLGMHLGGYQITIGPIENIQFLYVLLDRSLIFYSHVINWAHGKRDDYAAPPARISESVKSGFTAEWDDHAKSICTAFFMAIRSSDEVKKEASCKKLKEMLKDVLHQISYSEQKYGLIYRLSDK